MENKQAYVFLKKNDQKAKMIGEDGIFLILWVLPQEH